MSVEENLKALMIRHGMTQDAFARAIGVSQPAVSGWFHGKTPSNAMLHRICKTFDVQPNDILSDECGLANSPQIVRPPQSARKLYPRKEVEIPLLGRVHAGEPTEPDILQRTVPVPAFLIAEDPDSYALQAEGDCMNLVYPEGCIIVVSPNRPPVNGSVAVVSIDGLDHVMRRLYRTPSTLVLSPESSNPEHEDIVIRANDGHTVEFLGRVVWFQAESEMR